jgi:uncharacterized membrane protein SpoIIM required for sporulation
LLDILDNSLYISDLLDSIIMSYHKQIQTSETKISKTAIGLLIFILAFGLFIVGYDQGQLFSFVQGDQAYNDLWIHEFSHDMRHAAGFPCH